MKTSVPSGNPIIVFAIALQFFPLSCDIRKSDADPSESFTAVYDHPDMNLSFYPVDVSQTGDDGYLVLSVYTDTLLSTFPLIRLMKTDDRGGIERELMVGPSWCSAVPSLVRNGSAWQFVCMDAVNQNTKLMQVNESLSGISEVTDLGGKYPLYMLADTRNNLVVLTFDRIARTSVLTRYTDGGTRQWESVFKINEDYKNQVETHLKRAGKQFPFFIIQAGDPDVSHYLVNCFFNYTMTLLFTDANNGNHTGQLNTYQDDAAISSAIFLDGSRFGVSRFYMGDNFIFPSVTLDMNNNQGANTFADIYLPELSADAAVRAISVSLHNREVVVFASQTKSNRIVLYFFDKENGQLLTIKYLSSTNPVIVSALVSAGDGGLVILAQTYVAGRFPRNSLFKLSPEEITF